MAQFKRHILQSLVEKLLVLLSLCWPLRKVVKAEYLEQTSDMSHYTEQSSRYKFNIGGISGSTTGHPSNCRSYEYIY
jgi:hypothetical protein